METQHKGRDCARYKAAQDQLETIDKRIDIVTDRLEGTTRDMDGVPRRLDNIEQDMNFRSSVLEKLRENQEMHGMKLNLLEMEMNKLRVGNEMMMGYMKSPRDGGYDRERDGNRTDRSERSAGKDVPCQNGDVNGRARREPSPPSPRTQRGHGFERRQLNTAERLEEEEDERWERRRQIYGVHDRTDINPHKYEKKRRGPQEPWIVTDKDGKVQAIISRYFEFG